jgi:hypothetical protein
MKNISKLLAIFILIAGFNLAQAQKYEGKDKAEMKAKMESLKTEFVVEKAELTESEKKAFLPIYKSYLDELSKGKYEGKKGKPDFATMSDKEVEAMLDKRFEDREARLKIERTYHEKFKSILPVKKVALVYQAERDFKKEMWEKYKEKK